MNKELECLLIKIGFQLENDFEYDLSYVRNEYILIKTHDTYYFDKYAVDKIFGFIYKTSEEYSMIEFLNKYFKNEIRQAKIKSLLYG